MICKPSNKVAIIEKSFNNFLAILNKMLNFNCKINAIIDNISPICLAKLINK